jgi:hypothetical protein
VLEALQTKKTTTRRKGVKVMVIMAAKAVVTMRIMR